MAELVPSPIADQKAMCSTPVRPIAGGDAAELNEILTYEELLRNAGRTPIQPTLTISPPWSSVSGPSTAASSLGLAMDASWITHQEETTIDEEQQELDNVKPACCSAECLRVMDEMKTELLHMKETIDRQGEVIETLMQNDIEEKKRKLEEGQGYHGFFGSFGCQIM